MVSLRTLGFFATIFTTVIAQEVSHKVVKSTSVKTIGATESDYVTSSINIVDKFYQLMDEYSKNMEDRADKTPEELADIRITYKYRIRNMFEDQNAADSLPDIVNAIIQSEDFYI